MPTYFPEVDEIQFEGPQSKNPLAFQHFNATERGHAVVDAFRQQNPGRLAGHHLPP